MRDSLRRIFREMRVAVSKRLLEGEPADAVVENLDAKLREWRPETAAQVRERIAEVIELADQDVLDVTRPRAIEQEVLDLLDERSTR